jgi:hypothetical protein
VASPYEKVSQPDMVTHVCNPSTHKTEGGGSQIQGQMGYVARSCQEGRKEGKREGGRREGRKEGKKEGRKEGRKKRKDGRKVRGKEKKNLSVLEF